MTASHNPKEDNGFKVYGGDGGQLLPPATDDVQNRLENPEKITETGGGEREEENDPIPELDEKIVTQYFRAAQKALGSARTGGGKEFPVVFTGHHGTTVKIGPAFLRECGYTVVEVAAQGEEDSEFTNSPYPNPEVVASFARAQEVAEKVGSKIILACDPDGDRLGVMI